MLSVAILGASSKPDRYAYLAQKQLMQHGYTVRPISQKESSIMGIPTVKQLSDIKTPIDTVTVYINPTRLQSIVNELIALKPRRVIFNPNTESPDIEKTLTDNNIHVVEACTLVLLSTHQFETV